jgi:AraC-like DNA-binding protein
MAGFRQRGTDFVDLQVVPYPAFTIVLDLRDGVELVDEVTGQQRRGSVVAGLAPGSVRGSGRDIECLQIRVSPAIAHAVLGPPGQLGGTLISLEDLWGRDAARLGEQLRDAPSWDNRFALAQDALARRYEAGPAVDPEIAFAWEQMMTTQGRLRVDGLASETGWSRHRLWSRFRSQVGTTPKRAAQLVRFDHAAHRLAAGESAALVAAESGYADQSHLHRDVRTFTGITPGAVAAAPWLAVDDVAWPAHSPAASARKPAS